MGNSVLDKKYQNEYLIIDIDAEKNVTTGLTSKKIKPIFEEKFFIEPNNKFDCKLKKRFKYRNDFYTLFIFLTEIDFSVVMSRTGYLRNFLIDKSENKIKKIKNEISNIHEILTIPKIQLELFEKLFKSIDKVFLQEMFYSIFELYLKRNIRFRYGELLNLKNEIMYKFVMQGKVEFVILTDDTEIFIDILSGKEKSEYFFKIKEAMHLKSNKNAIRLI